MHVRVVTFAAMIVTALLLGISATLGQAVADIEDLRQHAHQLFNDRKYAEALAAKRSLVAGIEKLEIARDGRPGKQMADELCNLAWYALFARVPEEALSTSERAHKLAPESLPIETNRAHALLFLGRTREAEELYLLHKRKRLSPDSDKIWDDVISEDFDLLRAAGIVHGAFPGIIAQLGVAPPDLNTEIESAREKLSQLFNERKYQEAVAAAETLIALTRKQYGEESTELAAALSRLAISKERLNLTAEAEELHKRSLATYETALGPEHPDVVVALENLAGLYQEQERYAEAEPLYRRRVAIYEKAHGPDHPDVATALTDLALLWRSQRRNTEAEPLLKRSLSIFEKTLGFDHHYVGGALLNLALLYRDQGLFAEAEPLFTRSLSIYDKAPQPDNAVIKTALMEMARMYRSQRRDVEAEPLFKRSLAISETARGAEDSEVAEVLGELAGVYRDLGRYGDAELLNRRSLTIYEKALGPDHPHVGTMLNNLAALYHDLGRFAEAEQLLKRSLTIYEKAMAYGPKHPVVAQSLLNLAEIYRAQGRYAEAEPLLKRSLEIRESALGPEHRDVAQSLNNLAALYRDQGRLDDAEPLFKRSLEIRERALGPEHPEVALCLNNLAMLYLGQSSAVRTMELGSGRPPVPYRDFRRLALAEPLLERSLAIREKVLGPDHPDVAQSLNNLAQLMYDKSNWVRAAEYGRRSTDIIKRRAARDPTEANNNSFRSEALRLSWYFAGLIKASHHLLPKSPDPRSLAGETFETAQWSQGSEAAASLAQMAARSAKGSPELATLVRERQDLVADWQVKDKLLIDSKSLGPAKRNAAAEKALTDRLAEIETRRVEIDRRLAQKFPEYTVLASPAPVSVADVQAQLGGDEALVLFLDTESLPEETFVWFVTKSGLRWVRLELGTAALNREVAALRCGLDRATWEEDGGSRCAGLLKIASDKMPKSHEPLPFDVARAHALYKALFGQAEDLIHGKHLLIIPSGPLTQLPFHVLVTESVGPSATATIAHPPGPDGRGQGKVGATVSDQEDLVPWHRRVAWLPRRHATTVLPAVSSLKALRRIGRPSAATKPMIGFGNPLLDGDPAMRPWEAEWVRLSREKQACPPALWQGVAGLVEKRRGVQRVPMRSGHADLEHLLLQTPLPDTADELCAVAKHLRLATDDILLGDRATETNVKELSSNDKLSAYRVVHFATHGAMAGEIVGTNEPGLILTPPPMPTDLDDGYLSASEVAGLKLDADWVILSACNTAAGGAQGGEALSGLARAFIYAGARAMLVSHWAVNSAAAVKLVSTAVGATAQDRYLGRAEALRRSMLALIDKGEPHEAHPAYWAPFVVVGEGGMSR
jgi:tetratricopeptide (TPR) repeat protein